jgi:alcohol dehydrogenase class IV
MAIVEPQLTVDAAASATSVDALTHALEAAVSIFASPHTDVRVRRST